MSTFGDGVFGAGPFGQPIGGGGISGTRVQNWTRFETGGQTYHAGNGVTLDGTVLSLEYPLTIPNGGTGALDIDTAVDNLELITPYRTDLPALVAGVPCLFVHGLDTPNVAVTFRSTGDNRLVSLDWAPLDDNTIIVYSQASFPANTIRVETVG